MSRKRKPESKARRALGYAQGGPVRQPEADTTENQYANAKSSDTVKASTKSDWTPEAYQASLRQQQQGYARGGVVRRIGYADGGNVIYNDAGSTYSGASSGLTDYSAPGRQLLEGGGQEIFQGGGDGGGGGGGGGRGGWAPDPVNGPGSYYWSGGAGDQNAAPSDKFTPQRLTDAENREAAERNIRQQRQGEWQRVEHEQDPTGGVLTGKSSTWVRPRPFHYDRLGKVYEDEMRADPRDDSKVGYARGGAVRGYAEGGEIVDESAGLNLVQAQEQRAQEEAARRQAEERQQADRQASAQREYAVPTNDPLGQGATELPVALSKAPLVRRELEQLSFDEKAARAPSVQDVLDYAHRKHRLDVPDEAVPLTGYGTRGPADIASRQTEESRSRMAGRATEGMVPLERMTPETGTGQLIGGALRRAAGDATSAFTSKLTEPSQYDTAVATATAPLRERFAAYARGDHAVPPEHLDAHLQQTAAANPQSSPAEVAVKAVTDEKLDPDQQAGLLGGMSQRYQLHNAMAQGAMAHGDVAGAMRLAQEAHNHVPDGQNLSFRQDGDRIIATVDPLGKTPPTSYAMTMQQFHDYLVGPATSFDHVVVNGVGKNLRIASGGGASTATGYGAALAGGAPGTAYSPVDMGQARSNLAQAMPPEARAQAQAPAPRYVQEPAAVTPPVARVGRVDAAGNYITSDQHAPGGMPQQAEDRFGIAPPAPPVPRDDAIRPWGGTLNRPEVGWDKEATRELGGKGDTVRNVWGGTRGGGSEHKPRGAGAFYRDETLIRTPQYQAMQRSQGAVPIIDRRGYIRGWQTVPGTSDFDQIPQSAYTARPGTQGTPRADGTYATEPAPRYVPPGAALNPPVWNPNTEGQPIQGGQWRPPIAGTIGPPPPPNDMSPEARAARQFPAASEARQRDAAVEKFTSEDAAEKLEYAKLASAERRGELTTEQKIQLETIRQQGQTGRNEATIAGRKDVATTNITGRQTLQEQRDRAHAERQQSWIDFRQDKTAQEIAQKVLTSRENQLIRLYDTHLATGTPPPPDAVAAARKLAAAVNAAGYQAPEMPHAAVGATASQAAGRTASGLPAAAPAPAAAPQAAPQAAPNASRFEIHVDPETGQRYRVPVQ